VQDDVEQLLQEFHAAEKLRSDPQPDEEKSNTQGPSVIHPPSQHFPGAFANTIDRPAKWNTWVRL